MKAVLACLGLSLLASQTHAQPMPVRSPSLSFETLVMAQIDPNNGHPQVAVSVDAFHTQRRNIVHPANRIRLDTADGKTLLLKYPKSRTARVERDAVVAIIPVGKQQVKVSAKEFRFYRIDGRAVPLAEAARVLEASRPMFLLDDTDVDPPEVSDVHQQAINPDCLIAITRKRVRETNTDVLPDSVPEPAPRPPQ